jgi:hypothetical protein
VNPDSGPAQPSPVKGLAPLTYQAESASESLPSFAAFSQSSFSVEAL